MRYLKLATNNVRMITTMIMIKNVPAIAPDRMMITVLPPLTDPQMPLVPLPSSSSPPKRTPNVVK